LLAPPEGGFARFAAAAGTGGIRTPNPCSCLARPARADGLPSWRGYNARLCVRLLLYPLVMSTGTTVDQAKGFRSDDRLEASIASYEASPATYAARYYSVDMGSYLDTFVDMLPRGTGPVLDAGCGPGRDCVALHRRGISVVGLDRSSGLLAYASARTTAPLVLADLRNVPFRESAFEGIWACASLVHLGTDGVADALTEFRRAMAPSGVLFTSVPYGIGEEWRSDDAGGRRWFTYHTQSRMEELLRAHGFDVVKSSTDPGAAAGIWINLFSICR
jgi:SAM-dependent methyltransferase